MEANNEKQVGSSSSNSIDDDDAISTKKRKRTDDIFDIMNPFDMPGLRFTPTELDLVTYFIRMKIEYENFSFPEIHDVNIYDYNPQQLAEKFMPAKENEWYFFSSRDRKYPNGTRPNRAAGDGYWKATGADERIKSDDGKSTVGYKKTLTFFQGKPPKGEKLGWIMNEFTLEVKPASNNSTERTNPNDKMMLDKWVLCRIHEIIGRSNKKAKKEDKSNDDRDQPAEDIPQEGSQALRIYDTNNNINNNSVYGAGNTQVANDENAVVEHSNEPTNAFGEDSPHHINFIGTAPPVFDSYCPAGGQYIPGRFNGDPGYITQVSQALQIYDTSNNISNDNHIVEHSNEPMSAFVEESLHHTNSTGIAPLRFGSYSAGDQYFHGRFNGDPGHPNDYIPQVSQVSQIYNTNNNDNNIYGAGNIHFANNENAILEHHSNELPNGFGEESLHHLNSTNVDPLGIDYYSVDGQLYNPAMFNGHSNHLDEYSSQVSQAPQVYNNIINNNNIYVANNQSAIVEHLNEPVNAFAEESLHHINSTDVVPLVGSHCFPARLGIDVENVTENVCHGKLGPTNPAAVEEIIYGGRMGFDKNAQVNLSQNPLDPEQNYDDFWLAVDDYLARTKENSS